MISSIKVHQMSVTVMGGMAKNPVAIPSDDLQFMQTHDGQRKLFAHVSYRKYWLLNVCVCRGERSSGLGASLAMQILHAACAPGGVPETAAVAGQQSDTTPSVNAPRAITGLLETSSDTGKRSQLQRPVVCKKRRTEDDTDFVTIALSVDVPARSRLMHPKDATKPKVGAAFLRPRNRRWPGCMRLDVDDIPWLAQMVRDDISIVRNTACIVRDKPAVAVGNEAANSTTARLTDSQPAEVAQGSDVGFTIHWSDVGGCWVATITRDGPRKGVELKISPVRHVGEEVGRYRAREEVRLHVCPDHG